MLEISWIYQISGCHYTLLFNSILPLQAHNLDLLEFRTLGRARSLTSMGELELEYTKMLVTAYDGSQSMDARILVLFFVNMTIVLGTLELEVKTLPPSPLNLYRIFQFSVRICSV